MMVIRDSKSLFQRYWACKALGNGILPQVTSFLFYFYYLFLLFIVILLLFIILFFIYFLFIILLLFLLFILFLLFVKNAKSDVLRRQYDKRFQWILCVYHEFLDKYQGFLTLELNLVRLGFHDCVNSLRSNNPNEHCIQMYFYFQWKPSSLTNRSASFLDNEKIKRFHIKGKHISITHYVEKLKYGNKMKA